MWIAGNINSTCILKLLNVSLINSFNYDFFFVRYISPCEATWRIFGFPIHARKPTVERLHFHLPGQHSVLYEDDDDIDDILSKPSISDSKFLAWMNSNKCFQRVEISLIHNLFPNLSTTKRLDHGTLERKTIQLAG